MDKIHRKKKLSSKIWDIAFVTLGMDLRSLALFRICIGFTCIWDLVNRWTDLKAHYSDYGVLPRSLVLNGFTNELWMSVHMMAGTVFFEGVVFIIHSIICFFFAIGYKMKFMSVLMWFFTISLQNRNIIVLHGGDTLLRELLFFSMFLPLGECFSVDNFLEANAKNKFSSSSQNISKSQMSNSIFHFADSGVYVGSKGTLRRGKHEILSVATFAISFQYALMYITSYFHKTGEEWSTEGTSATLALSLDFFRTSIGTLMLHIPLSIMKYITIGTLWWEGLGPILFYSPIKSAQLRLLGVLGFAMMHVGFGMSLRLGLFGPAPVFGLFMMLPSWFWESIVFWKLRSTRRCNYSFYYQDACSFCKAVGCFAREFLLIPESNVFPLSSKFLHSSSSSFPIFSEISNGNTNNNNNRNTNTNVTFTPSEREASEMNETQVISDNSVEDDHWFIAHDFQGHVSYDFEAIVSMFRVSPFLWPLYYILSYSKSISNFSRSLFEQTHIHPPSENIGIERKRASMITFESKLDIRYLYKQFFSQIFEALKLVFWNISALIFVWYIFGLNLKNIHIDTFYPPNAAHWMLGAFNQDQVWRFSSFFSWNNENSMFSPQPPDYSWHYHIEGELTNGTRVELMANGGLFSWETEPFTFEKPEVWWGLKNHRWFKYFENGINSHEKWEQLRLHFGGYVCREYNDRHPGDKRLYTFKLHMVTDQTNPYEPFAPRVRKSVQMLWHHKCYDREPAATTTQEEKKEPQVVPEAHGSILESPKTPQISISRTQSQDLPVEEESKVSDIRRKIVQFRQKK